MLYRDVAKAKGHRPPGVIRPRPQLASRQPYVIQCPFLKGRRTYVRWMTNDEILDRWHAAVLDHRAAEQARYGQTLFTKMAAESDAIDRFGLGLHRRAYHVRFPGEEEA